jgi:hypothetical protein
LWQPIEPQASRAGFGQLRCWSGESSVGFQIDRHLPPNGVPQNPLQASALLFHGRSRITAFHGWATMVDYVGNVKVADTIFVVVALAPTGDRADHQERNKENR